MIGVSGRAIGHWPWAQYRSFGASALDIGLVAAGSLDGFLDTWFDAHGVWDFAASSLIVTEAGGVIVDALGRDLVVLDHDVRRTPIAAATPELLDELLAARERNPLAGPE